MVRCHSLAEALLQRLAGATTPLLIRGLLDGDPGWRAQADALGNRSALLERFAGERTRAWTSFGTISEGCLGYLDID